MNKTKELTVIKEQIVLGKDFKVYGSADEPLFLAKDVSEWIEYNKDNRGMYNTSEMLGTLDEGEKIKITGRCIVHTGDKQRVSPPTTKWFVTEDGLYEILMLSRKPIAKKFKKQVKQILKDIRKDGVYMTNEVIEKTLFDPDYIIKIAMKLKEERAKVVQLETKIDRDVPKLKAYDSLLAQKNNMSMLYASKLLNICGRNTLFKVLRDEKVFLEGRVVPYQSYIREGYFKVVFSHKIVQGESIGFPVTLITPKGLVWLRKRLESYYSNGYILKYTEMGVVAK